PILDAALVLAANGIRTYLFRSLRATPQLSFAVRHLQANTGVVITASHNPPEYNGYKAYGADGCQLVPEDAEQVIAAIAKVASFDDVKRMSQQEAEEKGLLVWVDSSIDEGYVQTVVAHRVNQPLLQGELGQSFKI